MKPEDCDALFAESVTAGDVDAALRLFEPDARCVTRDGVVPPEGTRANLERLAASKARLVCRVTRVVPFGEDLALLYNEWTITIPEGGGEKTRSGKALELVRRRADGTWRFVIDDPYGRS